MALVPLKTASETGYCDCVCGCYELASLRDEDTGKSYCPACSKDHLDWNIGAGIPPPPPPPHTPPTTPPQPPPPPPTRPLQTHPHRQSHQACLPPASLRRSPRPPPLKSAPRSSPRSNFDKSPRDVRAITKRGAILLP